VYDGVRGRKDVLKGGRLGCIKGKGDDRDKNALSFAGWEPPLVRGQIASLSCRRRASKDQRGASTRVQANRREDRPSWSDLL